MIRKHLAEKNYFGEKDFRWRGGEITRLEGFTDAVFAFAVTLLVVSLEVPHSFHDLMHLMKGFGAFAICFALLMLIWHEHYIFFRRFGVHDTYTVVLNAALLFVVLFYIYPLKFLFTLIIEIFFGMNGSGTGITIEGHEVPTLMLIYSIGYLAVFITYTLLYLHAYGLRKELELNPFESLRTRKSIAALLICCGVAVLSILVVILLPLEYVSFAGWVYVLIGPLQALNGVMHRKQVERLTAEIGANSEP